MSDLLDGTSRAGIPDATMTGGPEAHATEGGALHQQQELPPWPADSLSSLMQDAEQNSRSTAFGYPEIYALLQRVHSAFLRASEATEHDNQEVRLIPRFLMGRAHASCLAAMRLSVGGQLLEGAVVLRVAIEQAWYALHIAKDPTLARAETWLRRDEDEQRCKNEFKVENVRKTHELHDPPTAEHVHALYKLMIELGAHPNPLGLLAGLAKTEAPGTMTFRVPILCTDTVPLVGALQKVVAVGVGVLKIHRLIFPERFMLTGLDREIDGLAGVLNSLFRQYVPPRG